MKLTIILALLVMLSASLAQESAEMVAEKEKVKSAIVNETDSWLEDDFEGWVNSYDPNSFVLWVNAGVNFYDEQEDWNTLKERFERIFKNRQGPLDRQIKQDNFSIHVMGDMAFASYDQHTVIERDDHPVTYTNRELRSLVKVNGEWKIIFMGALVKSQYTDTTWANTEAYINSLGYLMLDMNRPREAAKVLQLNTEFFPSSANAWDSLGEAYMLAGENELAIEHYKKSLALNPENEHAKKMLKTLGN